MKKTFPKIFLRSCIILSLLVSTTCTKLEKSLLVSTGAVTSFTNTEADAPGTIIDLADGATQHGHCYGTTPNLNITGTKTELGVPTATGGFTSQLTGLSPGTKYYVKAYLSNGAETVYGKELIFTTLTGSGVTLTTTEVTDATATTASGGGNITSDGGSSVTARGVCWNTASGPTISNQKSSNGTGSGNFVSSLTGLTASMKYYVRAYATTSEGATFYGNEVNFTTSSAAGIPPTITTAAISSFTSSTAVSGGNITAAGSSSITAKGVCWGTTLNPTTSDLKTNDGTGPAAFTSNISGLNASTSYHVRAYATNSSGTAYGQDVSFTTSPLAGGAPSLTTTAVTGLATTTAISGGVISSQGGSVITAKGVCWSTLSNPTTSDLKTSDGSGSAEYYSYITGLNASTNYHVRAYATNSSGTAYGNDVSFITKDITITPPSDLVATAGSSSEINLTWTDNSSNEDGFKIERSPDGSSNWSEIAVEGANVTVYNNSGLLAATTYYYRVRSYKGSNNSSYSNTANASTTAQKAILHIVNNTHYDMIDVVLNGTQYVTTSGTGLAVSLSDDVEFSSSGTVTYNLGVGFWNGPTRNVWFYIKGDINVTAGSTTNLVFDNPTIGQFLSNFSTRDWVGIAYDEFYNMHYVGYKFTNTGGWTFYYDGTQTSSGSVTLVSWPDYASTISFKTCSNCYPIEISFPFSSFLYANGLGGSTIEYIAQ
jgi:hypothetical protein